MIHSSTLSKIQLLSEPVELLGEGNFRLGDVKQVVTTKDFNSLDESTRGCQMETSFEDCVTKKSLETLVNICNCMPYNLKNYSIADGNEVTPMFVY